MSCALDVLWTCTLRELTNTQVSEDVDWNIIQLCLIHFANIQLANPCSLEDHLREEKTADEIGVRGESIVILQACLSVGGRMKNRTHTLSAMSFMLGLLTIP